MSLSCWHGIGMAFASITASCACAFTCARSFCVLLSILVFSPALVTLYYYLYLYYYFSSIFYCYLLLLLLLLLLLFPPSSWLCVLGAWAGL